MGNFGFGLLLIGIILLIMGALNYVTYNATAEYSSRDQAKASFSVVLVVVGIIILLIGIAYLAKKR